MTKILKLYLLSQDVNCMYDTYDSCVVVSESREKAVRITPNGTKFNEAGRCKDISKSWVTNVIHVKCKEIGNLSDPSLKEGDVVTSSFNPG